MEKSKEKFIELIKYIVKETEEIDNETSAIYVEPQWWLDMMEIQRKAIEAKMNYIKYEI